MHRLIAGIFAQVNKQELFKRANIYEQNAMEQIIGKQNASKTE